MAGAYQSLTQSRWTCKYHVVFVPKRRGKALFGHLRQALGPIFHALARQKECRIIEGHLMPDHVHMMISIAPKYAVSQMIGFIKGKRAIYLVRVCGEWKRNFVGQHFWARGTSFPRWGVMKQRYESTSGNTSKRIAAWSN